MADVNSASIISLAAIPRVRPETIKNGILKSATETLEVSTSVDATHILRFVVVPSSASPRALKVWADAAITSGAADFGVYDFETGLVVDADLFASELAVGSGLTGADQMFESGVIDEAEVGLALWQLVGLSADPNALWVIAATVTTEMGAAGTLSIEFQYVDTN